MALSGFGPREHAQNDTNMKKTYIEPKLTIVDLKLEGLMCISGFDENAQVYTPETRPDQANGGDGLGREIIQSRDAWEEW